MPLKNLLRAKFLVALKGHKQEYVHIGNAQNQRGYRESGTPWKTTSSIEKSNWAPSPWKRLNLLTYLTTPCLDWKNYSFFEINIGPPL